MISDATFVRPAWGVLTSDQDPLMILLSLRNGRFYTLNETGSAIWRRVGEGQTVQAVINGVAASFGGSEGVAHRVRDFVTDLVRQGVLSIGPKPPALSVSRIASEEAAQSACHHDALPTAVALVYLTLVAAGLRIVGTERTWRFAHRNLPQRKSPISQQQAAAVTQAVSRAATLLPWRARCLQQSLATLCLLRKAGIDAHLRLGVQQFPFYAHAWVQVGDMTVNDSPEMLKLYRPFAFLDMGRP
jgi:hypothetical protein